MSILLTMTNWLIFGALVVGLYWIVRLATRRGVADQQRLTGDPGCADGPPDTHVA